MIDAYEALHRQGHAHSVEVWDGDGPGRRHLRRAVGPPVLRRVDVQPRKRASKVALLALARLLHEWGFPLIDAQVANAHTLSLGAHDIPRSEFLYYVSQLTAGAGKPGSWAAYGIQLPGLSA